MPAVAAVAVAAAAASPGGGSGGCSRAAYRPILRPAPLFVTTLAPAVPWALVPGTPAASLSLSLSPSPSLSLRYARAVAT